MSNPRLDERNAMAQMVMQESETILKNLKKTIASYKPKLVESVFVNRYLPILTARGLKWDDGTDVKVDINHWLEVARYPSAAVDIVDDVTGEVLFEVPPLAKSSVGNRPSSGLSFDTVATVYAKMLESNPRLSIESLYNEYKDKNGAMDVSAEIRQWIDILKRYNLLHTLVAADADQVITSAVTEADGNIPVDSDYDDL